MDIKVFYGVPIYTMDSKNSVVEAVVTLNGKIAFVGSLDEANAKYSYSEMIKLDRGILMPGFVEPHINLLQYSNIFRDLDFSNVREKEELVEIISAYIRNRNSKENRWIIGGGLNPNLIETVTRRDLDKAAPFNSVLFYSRDFHTAVANTKALEISGIDDNYKNPMGGIIERDGRGEITGVLKDRAIDIVTKFIDTVDLKRSIGSLKSGIDKLLDAGITTFCDFSSDSSASTSVKATYIRQIMQINRNDELKSRIIFMLDDRDAEFLARVGIISQFGSENLITGGVKLVLDGTLPSMTAYMKKPYKQTRSNGVLLYSEDELYKLIREFNKNYLWTSIQSVGDAANEIALKVYERLGKDRGIPALLKRIDYAESLTNGVIEGFAKNGIITVVTPSHIPYIRKKAIDLLFADAGLLFRIKSLINAGVRVAFTSDAPVVYPDPIHAIYCAVERKDYHEGPELRFYPKEHIDVIEAIKAVTIDAAHACGMQDKIGSIEVGKRGDMIQLSKDIFKCNTIELKDIEVLRTFVDGEDATER